MPKTKQKEQKEKERIEYFQIIVDPVLKKH